MYISARARLHDGPNSHHDDASLLDRGANGCISIVFAGCITQDQVSCRHTFIILFPCLCATAIWLGVVSSALNLFDQRIAWLR
jgi:hypothetical protein